jgi:hypothetical protein
VAGASVRVSVTADGRLERLRGCPPQVELVETSAT